MLLPLRLETRWTPASQGEPPLYELRLTNGGRDTLTGFTLGISGPARIDPAAAIEGGRLVARLSNHTELAPPENFALAPGATWTLRIRGLSDPLRHWSDA
ncbi:MAG TPA: beta-N-acetylhexosaminidase, partial [Devosiaceae bacterium]|nr:beta-N-acetylhexosaminidase [Devosiaceae bacterium]